MIPVGASFHPTVFLDKAIEPESHSIIDNVPQNSVLRATFHVCGTYLTESDRQFLPATMAQCITDCVGIPLRELHLWEMVFSVPTMGTGVGSEILFPVNS
jgi:hypothetical protein